MRNIPTKIGWLRLKLGSNQLWYWNRGSGITIAYLGWDRTTQRCATILLQFLEISFENFEKFSNFTSKYNENAELKMIQSVVIEALRPFNMLLA